MYYTEIVFPYSLPRTRKITSKNAMWYKSYGFRMFGIFVLHAQGKVGGASFRKVLKASETQEDLIQDFVVVYLRAPVT